MKPKFTLVLKFILGLVITTNVVAQTAKNYNILLNSGSFIPEKNIDNLTNENSIFQKSEFNNSYYVVLQFNELPNDISKSKLKDAGIILKDYIPNLCFTSVISKNFDLQVLKQQNIRSIFQLTSEQKTVPIIMAGQIPSHAIKSVGYADLNIITYKELSSNNIEYEMNKIGALIINEAPMFKSFTIRVSLNKMIDLVALPFIQWVEPIEPPNELENTLGRTLHRANSLNDGVRDLKGDEVNIGVWDGGNVGAHIDFLPIGRHSQMEFSTESTHATHVSGTVLGRGLRDPKSRGMAPNAKLYAYDFNGDVQSEMSSAIPSFNLVVSSHSYGATSATCGLGSSTNSYSSTSRSTDLVLNSNSSHLQVHSAGNSQSACSGGWTTITGSGKPAKNNLVVANITSLEVLSTSSSCGPVQDGRIKPEISGFGTNVFSTYPNDAYATISGTSMSTPGISGTSALLYQRYKQLNSGINPPSTLIKNVILNSAFDIGNPGPDYRHGFGRINALEAVKILETNRYVINNISNGAINNINITVPSGAAKLRAMLTWNDPAGTANASIALVNNLDLTVINGANTEYPWVLDKNNPGNVATKGLDAVSNIEQVEIDDPVAGTYTLRVNGLSIPQGPQTYTLTWIVDMPFIEVTYPNGGESLNPGTTETITWNNVGVYSFQTIEYSVDNGATWIYLGQEWGTKTRLDWLVPTGLNTSNAKIRVTAPGISDVSDAGFKILGTVTGLTGNNTGCNPGEVILSWSAVTNATNYDVYILNTTTGKFDLIGLNVSGTTYTATGLNIFNDYWFTIRSKNGLTMAESERAIAIKVTASAGNLPPDVNVTPNSFTQCNDSPAKLVTASGGVGNFTWTPIAGLFTNAAATIPYINGDYRSTIYAKPLVSTKYTASSTNSVPCTAVDTSSFIINCSLPVSITNFSGSKEGSNNLLQWTTSSEQNNKGFEIERSVDGEKFNTIGFVNSKADNGYSSHILNYNFVDDKLNANTNYYRLRQIDLDSKFKLSNVVIIKGERISNIKISSLYPNPAHDKVSLTIESPFSESVIISISDIYGKQMMQEKMNVEVGTNLTSLNINKLAAGTYLLKITSNKSNEASMLKFIKSK